MKRSSEEEIDREDVGIVYTIESERERVKVSILHHLWNNSTFFSSIVILCVV